MPNPTPDEARDQLATLDTLASTTRDTARGSAKVGAVFTGAVGALVGAVLAATRAFAGHNTVAFVVTFVVYGIALILLITYQRRHQSVSGRGWGRTYLLSLFTTMALYAIGIVVVSGHQTLSWAVVAPYSVLVALPMVLGAALMLRAARR